MSSCQQEIMSCPICKNLLEGKDEITEIRQKGAESINAASCQRGDSITVTAGDKVHTACRKWYINKTDIANQLKKQSSSHPDLKRSARVSQGVFTSKLDCLFCGVKVSLEGSGYSYVRTDTFAQSILECCESRSDDWAFSVKGRIEYYGGDLHAADCLYHHKCSVNFRNGYNIPVEFRAGSKPESKRRKSGRPKDDDQQQAFLKMCEYLEQNDEEQLTISDLRDKMKEFLIHEGSIPYGNQYLKQKLKEQYDESIYIAEGEGLADIVTFREKTSHILQCYYRDSKKSVKEEDQKRVIIETAARLIKSDIKTNVPSSLNQYPSADELKLEPALAFLPETLQSMLNYLFVGQNKQQNIASIGQAIIQAARPRAVIAPLQIGLAVQTYHLYRSKFLVDTLSQMGFGSTYKEVKRFEKNAACSTDSLLDNIDLGDACLLFAGDNVDHNILTIDGKGTFHGMGMIAALTPGTKLNHTVNRGKLVELNVTDHSHIDIKEYRHATHTLRNIKFKECQKLTECDMKVDIYWELSFQFQIPVPNWQGMMHLMHQGHTHPGMSSIVYLPMIDMYPGDKTCILSTLEFISDLASKHNVNPVITFDQPLYWKAAEVIGASHPESGLRKIVLRLGNFHLFMNLIGAIGVLMEGSGLSNILEVVYGENAVVHMMSGKAIQRAFRGHLLVDKCLHDMVVKLLVAESPEFSSIIDEVETSYSSLMKGETNLEHVLEGSSNKSANEKLTKKRAELAKKSKTSQLWLGYQQMLSTARALVKADRTGSWADHLSAVANSLPVFAAAGHYNYLKSAYLYLQEMVDLEHKHPDVYKKFQDGFHVIRRTNQFWAGLSCDLVIEQTLMRALKSRGGLTHGSKMTEEQRALWTLSAPVMSEFNLAMQEFNDLIYSTSEQHKESTRSRIERDVLDLAKINTKLSSCSPFSTDSSLRNIVNGRVAAESVNVHEYESIGKQIIQKMIGHPVFSYSFSRKDKAKTMSSPSSVKIAPDQTIDPNLLFQRFLVVSKTNNLSLHEVMQFELSPYPPAIFEERNVMRKADKPQLSQAIVDYCDKLPLDGEVATSEIVQTERYVLDGGSLLHRLTWKTGSTYGEIVQMYANFTCQHYFNTATIVFDGYGAGPSIKDNTHQRREQRGHPLVNFDIKTTFEGKRDEFLARKENKQLLIKLLSVRLRELGCRVIQAEGDADVEIAKAAALIAHEHSTTLIGEDTDLLILLLHYASENGCPLYFRSDKQTKGPTKVYNINLMKTSLGKKLCTHLLFLHAFTGCDSTSRIFGIGKKSVFQKLVQEDVLVSCANAFTTHGKAITAIEKIGEQAMIAVFGGKGTDSLSALRYEILSKKVVSAKTFVGPERLPPTKSATKYHSYRVYYQVLAWMGMENDLSPLDWGWKLENNMYVPVMTDTNPAPESLLKIIHCNCNTGCNSIRCSCRKSGLPCTSACGPCQVTSCDNHVDDPDDDVYEIGDNIED